MMRKMMKPGVRLGSVVDHLPREAQAALLAHVRESCGCSEDDALPLHVKGDVFGAARGLRGPLIISTQAANNALQPGQTREDIAIMVCTTSC